MNVGIVGLGGMGRRHVEAVKMGNMQLAALCDLNAANSAEIAGTSDANPKQYTRWEEMISEGADTLDILIVATNGPTHSAIVQHAAQCEIPYVLCEKPMATNGQAARDMKRICQESGTVLGVNLTRRYISRYKRLKLRLQEGVIGEVRHINVVLGAGGLGCIGTHFFDLVAWLLDRQPIWVLGTIDKNTPPNVRGDSFYDPGGKGFVGMGDGVTANFELSGEVPVNVMVQIVGTQGFVEVDEWRRPEGGRIEIYNRPIEARDIPPSRFVLPQKEEFELGEPIDLVEASLASLLDLTSEAPEDTVAGGIAAVDTVIGFHLSSLQNWDKIELPLSGEQLLYDVPIT